MEVDGIDSTLEKPASNASMQNDTLENAPITKSVPNLGDDEKLNSISNFISNAINLERVQNETLQPPNGEQESPDHNASEPDTLQEPVHNPSIDSHLESNINIIENQNNENLERDSELMESDGSPDPPSSSIVESSSEPIESNCASKNDSSSENVCNESETRDLININNSGINSDLSSEPINIQNVDISEPQIPREDLEMVEPMCSNDTDHVNDSPNNTESSNTNMHDTDNLESDITEENSQNKVATDTEPSIEPMDVDTNENVATSEVSSIAEENDVNINEEFGEKENDTAGDTSDDKLESTDEVNRIEESLEQNETPVDNEISDCNAADPVPTNSNTPIGETLEKEKEPLEEQSSATDIEPSNSKSSNAAARPSIEFERVNFDSNDNEKDTEKTSSIVRGSELDPIASVSPDELDSIANSQGADEAITILPDSEREITEAEKVAASSLPTLKDISDKTQSTNVPSQESESTESEIKIYKYDKDIEQNCCQCKNKKTSKYHFTNRDQDVTYICDDSCLDLFKQSSTEKVTMATDEGTGIRVKNFMEGPPKEPPSLAFIRKCSSCNKLTDDIESNLTWEIMDFCNETCLSKYQKLIGSKCASCTGDVKSTSLGKYCVRFGNDIRQFCTSICLEQYKKGLKVCSYCQQDMSSGPDGFLAPVGEKGQFKDFCSKICMEKYDIMTNDRPPKVAPGTICSVCKTEKPISIEFEHQTDLNYFCGEPCFVAFAFVNKISPGKCAMCRRHFNKSILEKHTMYYDNVQYSFCSNSCENIYIIAHRKIVPCSWCKVKKYNFDMIKKYSKTAPVINMCSINCLNMYQVSLNAVNAKPSPCNYCKKQSTPAYHLTMSDATIRNFCTYACVMNFQNQFPKQITLNSIGGDPIPTGAPQKSKRILTTVSSVDSATSTESIAQLPVIASVQSLANTNGTSPPPLLPPGLSPISSTRLTRSKATTSTPTTPQPSSTVQTVQNVQNIDLPVQVQVKQHYIIKEKACGEQRNVAVMCQPRRAVKSSQTVPETKDAGVQTTMDDIKKMMIPVPVPIYVPTPCHMFSTPVPMPIPFPLPIPIPIFIPTTRNSAAGIMKEIKKIQVKIPTDPYEAELLMMAEMVAEEKKEERTDSESDIDDNTADGGGEYSPEPVDTNNTFGDDMLQMALKMATELDEPAVDLEGALTANTITAPQGAHPPESHPPEENVDDPQPIHPHLMERSPLRGRKRGMRGSPRGSQPKRGRRMSHHQTDMPMMQSVQPAAPQEPQEKPDANMCLKYTFGVNAWKQWVTTKNAELEKSARRVKLFKTEILQLTADELNYSLCLFVKEVRKPNGQEYAPDTIYYLCLGIQQYLFENGRIDNIFCDPYYEKFTDCLDEVAKKFSVLYNDSHYIVTRVEEEHLWESKQLGAHSPHVLLSTLMFFNTKHFNLTTVDEHMQLSFSHIMKHWKRNPNQAGASKVPGSRNVLLRFYPPQSALQNNQRKKKVYEQQENEENPLRCPVKLYEFYLSKCPESVKTRNDVFYLQPERSCVPDSPVWYSTMPLPKEALEKMLHRVKMVKEINVALLTS